MPLSPLCRRLLPLALSGVILILLVAAVLWLRRDEIRRAADGAARDAASDAARSSADSLPSDAPHVVFLVSFDGFSGTYLDAAETPRLHRAAMKGAYSTRLRPPFPSLTFPSHVSLATGRPVSGHGIPGNSFFDAELGEELRFPGDASLLRAEPIWTTAARQGLRVLSYDWPLSHRQAGPHRTAYFEDSFNPALGDAERLERVLDLWEADPDRGEGDGPLRLVTGYAKEADTVGHRHGPDAEETLAAVREVDAVAGEAMDRAIAIFESARVGDEQLYLVFVADHGMAAVTHYVNIEVLIGPEWRDRVIAVTGGNVANLYLAEPGAEDAPSVLAALDEAFSGLEEAELYAPGDLPEAFAYRFDGRTGDRVAVLAPGYTFNRAGVRPVSRVGEVPGLLGMHGYDVDEVPEMKGVLVIRRYPDPIGGIDLGPVESLQLHATIARLLGIEPAEGAYPGALPIP